MEAQTLRLMGERLYLRPVSEEDVTQEYFDWLNNPLINAGLVKDFYTWNEITEYVKVKSKAPNCYFFAIVTKGSNKMIGTIKLDSWDKSAQNMELGIMIGDTNFHGKGYGEEACKLLLNFGFNELNLKKIWLAVYESNLPAICLYEKLGFRVEGIQRKHIRKQDKLYDKYLMAIFKEDFAS